MKRSIAFLTIGFALIGVASASGFRLNVKAQIPRSPAAPMTDRQMLQEGSALLNRATTYVRPSTYVSPAAPWVDGKAYIRAAHNQPSIVLDARSDVLQIPFGPGGATLQLFVRGEPDQVTIVDCVIDGAGGIEAFVRLGPDSQNLVDDPLKRKLSVTGSANGHILVAIPADVPARSPSGWFAVHFAPTSTVSPTGIDYLRLYGCKIMAAG